MKGGYLVKIVPPVGYRVFRVEFSRRHIVAMVLLAIVAIGGGAGYYVWTLQHAEGRVAELRSLTDDQRSRLKNLDSQAAALDDELRALQVQNTQIRRLIGERELGIPRGSATPTAPAHPSASKDNRTSRVAVPAGDDFDQVTARVEKLRADSMRIRQDGDKIRVSALKVLNMARLADLARAKVLAAIPSINPAGEGVGIRSAYGWRVDPWPEFHRGIDLDVDYGDPVRASAAGTVVEASDNGGGYGIRVDIDHGNGYHTWYCHLSRADVRPGQYVTKGEHIALVGSTGESTGPHLHYQIMLDNHDVDPTPYLSGVPAQVLASLK